MEKTMEATLIWGLYSYLRSLQGHAGAIEHTLETAFRAWGYIPQQWRITWTRKWKATAF